MDGDHPRRLDERRWPAALTVCFGAATSGAAAAILVCVLFVIGLIGFQSAFYIWCSVTITGAVVALLIAYRSAAVDEHIGAQHDENYYRPAT
jgi:hypothetical protein